MTSSIKWEPIEDLKAIRDLLSRTFIHPWVPLQELVGVHPPVDLYETPGAYVALIDVPGLEPADVDISVSGHKLTVPGERKAPEDAPAYLHHERPTGVFSRTLRVPGDAKVGEITAKMGSGVLTLILPKAEGAAGTKVEVEAPKSGAKK